MWAVWALLYGGADYCGCASRRGLTTTRPQPGWLPGSPCAADADLLVGGDRSQHGWLCGLVGPGASVGSLMVRAGSLVGWLWGRGGSGLVPAHWHWVGR